MKIFQFLIRHLPENWKIQIKAIVRQIILDATGSPHPETQASNAPVFSSSSSLLGYYYQNLSSLHPQSRDFLESVEELHRVYKILKEQYPPRVQAKNASPQDVEVSIIIPVYSSHPELQALLHHLNNATKFDTMELIVVNDLPEEPLPASITDASYRFPITFVRNEWNMGFAGAVNVGANLASGKFLLFLNSDILPKNSDWLEHMVRLARTENTGLVGAKTLYKGSELIEHFGMYPVYEPQAKEWRNAHYFHKIKDGIFPETSIDQQVDMVTGAVMLVSSNLFEALNGFDERYFIGTFEDSDFCRRVRMRGYSIRVCANAILEHAKSCSLNKSPFYSDRRQQCNARLYNHLWAEKLVQDEHTGTLYTGFQRTDMVRVLYVAHGYPPDQMGGTEVYNQQLSTAVASLREIESIVLTRTPLEDSSHQDGEITFLEKQDGLYRFQCHRSGMFFLNEHRAAELEFEMFLRSVRPDVIHFNHTEHLSTNFVSIAKRCTSAPVFYTLHEFLPICANRGLLVTNKDELCNGFEVSKCAECVSISPELIRRREKMYRENFATVDLFIAPSMQLKQKYVEWGLPPERILYSRNGIRSGIANRHAVSKRPFRFGFIGQIMPHKGILTLLEACKILKGKIDHNFELQLHGIFHELQPSFKKDVLNRIEKLGKTAIYKGPYDNAQVGEILSEIDVLIVPSEWWENSPVTIQEAMANGVPVITTNLGGMKELVRDGIDGLHFVFKNRQDLAIKMQLILESPDLMQRLSNNLRQSSFKSIQENAHELVALYKQYLTNNVSRVISQSL